MLIAIELESLAGLRRQLHGLRCTLKSSFRSPMEALRQRQTDLIDFSEERDAFFE